MSSGKGECTNRQEEDRAEDAATKIVIRSYHDQDPVTLAEVTKIDVKRKRHGIGLYRENAIAIESEARDPFGGNVYYVTMQITFTIPEFARKGRNLHCDVVHVTTKRVSRLVLDHAIAAIQTSR